MFPLSQLSGYSKMLILGVAVLGTAIGLELRNRAEMARSLANLTGARDEAEFALQSLSARIQTPETCTELLLGRKIRPGETLEVGLEDSLDEGLTAGLFRLKVPAAEDMRTVIVDAQNVPTELHRFAATLTASFLSAEGHEIPARNGLTATNLPVYIWTLPPPPINTGELVSCFGPNSAGAICNDLGGYFIPNTTPYDQSCRLSHMTLRRARGGALVAAANCRIGGVVEKAEDCTRFGVHFGANQLQGASALVPLPGVRYLCQICQ